MTASRSSWDKWAPATYLFTIGLALGFVTGFAFGIMQDSSNAISILLIPVIAIVIAFIAFTMVARRIGKH